MPEGELQRLAGDCPVCAVPVPEEEARSCARCETAHHLDCWEYLGDCAIFGCREAEAPRELVPVGDPAALERDSAWWGRCFRFQWWSLLLAILAYCLLPMAIHHGPFYGGGYALMLVVGGVLLWGVAEVPKIWFRERLALQLDGPVTSPRQGLTRVLGRLELTGDRTLGLRVMEAFPWAYLLALYLLVPTPSMLGWMVLAGPFAFGVRRATRDRLAEVQVTQNRILATVKGRRALPGA